MCNKNSMSMGYDTALKGVTHCYAQLGLSAIVRTIKGWLSAMVGI